MKTLKRISVVFLTIIMIAAISVFLGIPDSAMETIVIEPEPVIDRAERVHPVKVKMISSTANIESIKYFGILQPNEMRKKTFTTLAEVEEIYVEDGQTVAIGDPLIKVDTNAAENNIKSQRQSVAEAKSLRSRAYQEMKAAKKKRDKANKVTNTDEITALQAEYALAEMRNNTAAAAYEKAQEDLENNLITQEELEIIYTEYMAAQSDLLTIRVRLETVKNTDLSIDKEIAQITYNAAKSNYQASDAQYQMQVVSLEQMEDTLSEGTMYSDMDGYVVQVLVAQGEMVNPLMPAIVLGSGETVVNVGISQNDVRKVWVGQNAAIKINDLELQGNILSMSKVPDEASRTYVTSISFPEEEYNFFIGETAIVEIITGTTRGIWIPINVIMNDGQDFVYIMDAGRASKIYIILSTLSNDIVLVEGLEVLDWLIIEGMSSLKPGYFVKPVNVEIETDVEISPSTSEN